MELRPGIKFCGNCGTKNEESVEKPEEKIPQVKSIEVPGISVPDEVPPSSPENSLNVTDEELFGSTSPIAPVNKDDDKEEAEERKGLLAKNITIKQDTLYNEFEKPKENKPLSDIYTARKGKKLSRDNPVEVQVNKLVDKTSSLISKSVLDDEDEYLSPDEIEQTIIIEQEEVIDPDDPTYDGYYENTIPLDKRPDYVDPDVNGKKIRFNDDAKKSIIILILLAGVLIYILYTGF